MGTHRVVAIGLQQLNCFPTVEMRLITDPHPTSWESRSYGALPAMWDHIVLHTTRQR